MPVHACTVADSCGSWQLSATVQVIAYTAVQVPWSLHGFSQLTLLFKLHFLYAILPIR